MARTKRSLLSRDVECTCMDDFLRTTPASDPNTQTSPHKQARRHTQNSGIAAILDKGDKITKEEEEFIEQYLKEMDEQAKDQHTTNPEQQQNVIAGQCKNPDCRYRNNQGSGSATKQNSNSIAKQNNSNSVKHTVHNTHKAATASISKVTQTAAPAKVHNVQNSKAPATKKAKHTHPNENNKFKPKVTASKSLSKVIYEQSSVELASSQSPSKKVDDMIKEDTSDECKPRITHKTPTLDMISKVTLMTRYLSAKQMELDGHHDSNGKEWCSAISDSMKVLETKFDAWLADYCKYETENKIAGQTSSPLFEEQTLIDGNTGL